MEPLILIVGTGRCGSSMVAGMAARLGVHFCDHIRGGANYTPDGLYYECQQAWTIGRRAEKAGAFMSGELAEYLELIENHRREDGPWGLKDPYLIFGLTDVVRGACNMGIDVRVIVVYRSFASVVDSRIRHDRLPYRDAIALQSDYVARLHDETRLAGRLADVLHVQYEYVLRNPEEETERMARFIHGIPDAAKVHRNTIEGAAEYVRPELDRSGVAR